MTQLAGHKGGFIEAKAGFMLKKLKEKESRCLKLLMKDELKSFVPEFSGVVVKDGAEYIEMKDLLMDFNSPAIMDVKIGTRTYVGDDDDDDDPNDNDDDDRPRPDLYAKMVAIDPAAPTEQERRDGFITKWRYMDYRDSISSTKSLGFRLEAVRLGGGAGGGCGAVSKDFKTLKEADDVAKEFRRFAGGDAAILRRYLERLLRLRETLEISEFVRSHEMVGSSLLFAHDADDRFGVWMIDFANTDPLPKGVIVTHRAPIVQGNHEDGYLFGVDNILEIFERLMLETEAPSGS